MSQTTSAMQRVDWVDYAKGIGIFSVVALHVLTGLISADIITTDWAIDLRDSWKLYSFNMVIFFFVGALFIERSNKKPMGRFVDDRLRTMVYPYFLWSFLSLVVGTILASQTNSDLALSGETVARLFYNPILHFWFLYAIFFVVMTYAIMARMHINVRWFFVLTFLLFVAGQIIDDPDMAYVLWGLMEFTIYFGLGALFSPLIRRVLSEADTRSLVLVSGAGLATWFGFVLAGVGFDLAWLQPVVTMMGGMGVLTLCVLISRMETAQFVRYWGLNSLEIYLAHVMAGAGIRIILNNFAGIDIPLLHLVLGIAGGMYLPLLLHWLTQKANFPYVFVIPKASKPAAAVPPAPALSPSGTD